MNRLFVVIVAAFLLPWSAVARADKPVKLRYVYKPGFVSHYTVLSEIDISRQTANQPAVQQFKQITRARSEHRILSSGRGQAQVAETNGDTTTEIMSGQGSSKQIAAGTTRTYTVSELGRVIKVERGKSAASAAAHEAFENLSFSLPMGAVSPGESWSETVDTFGLDGKPLTLRVNSTYVRAILHGGHPCAEIRSTFSGTIKAAGAAPSASGAVSGNVTYWFATDLGQETESDAEMLITLKSNGSADGKTAPATVTQRFAYKQVLVR